MVKNDDQSPSEVSLVERGSFGCISPISKIATTTTPTSKTKCCREKDITSPSSSLFRSTPDHSSSFQWNSMDRKMENTTHSSLTKRKSYYLADDRSSESNETVNFSYDDEMHFSYGSQQHPHTPTLNKSKRRCSSVNRKNLSRSFNQIEENVQSAISLDRTDSGFNDMNTQNDIFQNLPSLKYENFTETNCDISMASIQ